MSMEEKIKRLGNQMLNELYKKSMPSITWAQYKKKYEGTKEQGFVNHWLFKYEAESILDKYKTKCENKFEKDSLSWVWLDFCPKSVPNPGSKEAIKLKCICAVLDNCHGADRFGKQHGFYITEGCPVHPWEMSKNE